jgi:hypothetical protein
MSYETEANVKRHADAVAEGLRSEIRLVAEGVAGLDEKLTQEFVTVREEIREQIGEVKSLIRVSYDDLFDKEVAIIRSDMSKVAAPKAKVSRKVRGKSARIAVSTRRRRSKTEDRLDATAAMKALKESAERIPYQKVRRDLDL